MQRIRLSLFSILFLIILFEACQKAETPPPNIILINVDDLGWTDLGCYGSTYYETPNIDQMASEGVRFTNAYAAAAVCSPTRAALMTGKYPARLGITDWIRSKFQGGGSAEVEGYTSDSTKQFFCPKNPFHLPKDEKTIAEYLKEKGYATGHIGKWHLGTEGWYPTEQGFDDNIAGCDYGQPPTYFDPYIKYPNNWIKDTLWGFPTMEAQKPGEYLTDRETGEAIRFITKNKSQPFFLNLCHYAVHTPIEAKPKLIAKYESKDTTNQKSPPYAAMVESVDQALGNIRKALQVLGLEKNTVIIFTSDNGGLKGKRFTDNAPLRSGKGYAYEGGIRIPLIIHHPGHLNQASNETPVISMDVFSTIGELGGFSKEQIEIDGKSLMPLLKGGQSFNRESLFWHFPHYRGRDILPYSIIRQGDWKLIKRYGNPEFELFNLKNDLSESTDLAREEPEKVASLNEELEKLLEDVNAKVPKPNLAFSPLEN